MMWIKKFTQIFILTVHRQGVLRQIIRADAEKSASFASLSLIMAAAGVSIIIVVHAGKQFCKDLACYPNGILGVYLLCPDDRFNGITVVGAVDVRVDVVLTTARTGNSF